MYANTSNSSSRTITLHASNNSILRDCQCTTIHRLLYCGKRHCLTVNGLHSHHTITNFSTLGLTSTPNQDLRYEHKLDPSLPTNTIKDTITSISKSTTPYTIDLQCETIPVFYTDGIITHNTTIARIFAKAMNCENFKANNDICNECPACIDTARKNSQLYYEFDASVVGTVEGIKNITAMLQFIPNGRRVVVFDESHASTKQALNALLKLVEEGVKNTIFLFASTEDIIETIRSRSLCIDIGLINKDLIKQRVTTVMNDRGIQMSPENLELLAVKSKGHMRDALSTLQLYELCGEKALDTSYFQVKDYIVKCFQKNPSALEVLPEIMKHSTSDIRNSVLVFIRNILTPQPDSIEAKMSKAGIGTNLFSFFFNPVAQQALKDEIGIEILLKSLYERTKVQSKG